MILRAVSSNCIQQQIHDVYLKHRKFIPVHRHHKLNLRTGPIRHRRREVIPLPSRMMPNPRLLSIGLGYVTHYIGWHCESLKSVTITAISWGIGLVADELKENGNPPAEYILSEPSSFKVIVRSADPLSEQINRAQAHRDRTG